jgi:hypothetical protein
MMTNDAAADSAVGEQRLVGWLVGSRGVACPADQVRVRDRQTIGGELLLVIIFIKALNMMNHAF